MGQQVEVRTTADFALAVAEARYAAGLTQAQAAERAGIERTYLARMEAGLSTVLLTRLLRVLTRLGARVTVTLPDPGAARQLDGI